MQEFNTKNQVYPICPWCGEELDPSDLELDLESATLEEYHLSIDVICPSCNKYVEVTANFVYTTYKSEDDIVDDFVESTEEMYGEDTDEEEDIDEYE